MYNKIKGEEVDKMSERIKIDINSDAVQCSLVIKEDFLRRFGIYRDIKEITNLGKDTKKDIAYILLKMFSEIVGRGKQEVSIEIKKMSERRNQKWGRSIFA